MKCDFAYLKDYTMYTPQDIENALHDVSGGRLLDVATGGGGFITTLIESLKDYTEIVGIDMRETPPEVEDSVFKRDHISYQMMDAHALTFADASFDTVTTANSLHHMADPQRALAEMMRVLKPGGHLIVREMYRDHQTEEQLTHVYLHHWWGGIDRALGVSHSETFPRQTVLDWIEALGLRRLTVLDYADLTSDPHDEEQRATLHAQIARYLDRAKDLPNFETIRAESEKLAARLDTIGVRSATALFMIGEK
jgi:2-polyprenyl-3-methyl-5-hydroxy-6-metoxy-1,4-benzoquinol methylase